MKNLITINKTLKSRLHWFNLGQGAKLNLQEAEYPLLCFIWHSYLDDSSCISGDIKKLEQLIF